MEYVSHRAGNSIDELLLAQARGAIVEIDVHLGRRGVVEVRHGKRLWPSFRLWERFYLLPPDTKSPLLSDVVAAADPSTVLWLDLKGFTRRLTRRVIGVVGERRPIIVSSKAWWLLRPFAALDDVRTFCSVGNRFELLLLLLFRPNSRTDGVVLHRDLLTDPLVRRLHGRGEIFTWAVRDRESVAWLVSLGVDGLILDDLDLRHDHDADETPD